MTRDPNAHLTAEEIVGFVTEDLAEDEATVIDAHIEDCEGCARQLEAFYDAQESFPEQEWEARRASFASRLREIPIGGTGGPGREGGVLLMPGGALRLGKAAKTADDTQGWAEGGALAWSLHIDNNGDILVSLSSRTLEDGMRRWLVAGDWRREVVLRRVAPGEVGCEAVITRAERAGLPEGAGLEVQADLD